LNAKGLLLAEMLIYGVFTGTRCSALFCKEKETTILKKLKILKRLTQGNGGKSLTK
jgi:hypothetical protein